MEKVFIDGGSGTTGLKIRERLANRTDLEIIEIDEKYRKDPAAKSRMFSEADIVFLCLPDDAAKESVSIATEDKLIIDTSTAHRTHPLWTYGFAELTGMREKIASSVRVANPGCHASGFISLVAPLREDGIIKADERLQCFSLTGYSGGGKKMISEYENESRDAKLSAPRLYSLSQSHKHLPEMSKYCSLYYDPIFTPIVDDYFSGMTVCVNLFSSQISGSAEDIKEIYKCYYGGPGLVRYSERDDGDGMISASAFTGYDNMEVSVFGNKDRIMLVSRFDNLGKGASGAAIQNMNIMLGKNEFEGLSLKEEIS